MPVLNFSPIFDLLDIDCETYSWANAYNVQSC